MDPIYLIIVLVLLGLAALDLTVGVANDAVNFLNSSIGSRVAPMWVILSVASLGVMIGTLFSSGMMEIARSGVFHPQMFTFHNVMILFLAVMLTDVMLLDIFNSLGLPTSTTVSLIFELLGAAVGVALFIIWQNNGGNLAEYINTAKALAMITAIFVSVAVAFAGGSIIMYFSRVLFSFHYKNPYKYFGAIWGGFALTAITYFAVFKGLKGSSIMTPELVEYLSENMGKALLLTFAGWTVIMALLQYIFRVNILRIIVLAGTMALALAFAGNDLVNFIGVFMAGLSSFEIAQGAVAQGMDINNLYMDGLSAPVVADWRYLLGAGVIMVLALWFSKKSRSVTQTEVNLASQSDGMERFSSSPFARSLVRASVSMNNSISAIVPKKMRDTINSRFEPVKNAEDAPAFDLVRASVNLTIAALLISLGTSLKLPLSTTYVTFMVAMGTSLADRAWGRESAVYRINGVLTVISGWFITAFVAFTCSFILALFLSWGGTIAIFLMIALTVFILLKSSALHKKRKEKEDTNSTLLTNKNEIVEASTTNVRETIVKMIEIYQKNIEGLTNEDRKLLKQISKDANSLYQSYKDKRMYEVVPTIQQISLGELDIEQEYVQIIDYTYEITKALKAITSDSFHYIDNNHAGFNSDQEEDLKKMSDTVLNMYNSYIVMMSNDDYSGFDNLFKFREQMLELYAKLTKRQIKRVKTSESGTRSSILFLNILNESKNIVLQSINLMKAQRDMVKTTYPTHKEAFIIKEF